MPLGKIIWNFFYQKLARLDVKGKKIFSNRYSDLLVCANFTKFTGPAKLFLNNVIIFFCIIFYHQFYDFFLDEACKKVSKRNHPVDLKKIWQNPNKFAISEKLDIENCPLIQYIVMKKYARYISFESCFFCTFWIYLWANLLKFYWRCLKIITLQNPKNIKLGIPVKLVMHSFPFTPCICKKNTLFLYLLRLSV